MNRRIAIVCALATFVVISGITLLALKASSGRPAVRAGERAPDVVVGGRPESFAGRRTLLIFYKHSCGHCLNTIQALAALERQRPEIFGRLRVLLIAEDDGNGADPGPFDHANDSGQGVAALYGVRHVPFLVAVDDHATIHAVHLGELDQHQEEGFLNGFVN
jgi:hypothetical protein